MEKYIAPELTVIELDSQNCICQIETSSISLDSDAYAGDWD